jgi:hypothetical protein
MTGGRFRYSCQATRLPIQRLLRTVTVQPVTPKDGSTIYRSHQPEYKERG